MSSRPVDPAAVLANLKDFQRRTAEWAFQRMFLDDDATPRFLIADEVGLGKTHIAKGVIAQVLDHLKDVGDERHDIVYVCSNGAIARQNLRKLVPKGIEPLESVERLTMLPLVDLHRSAHGINLLAITPGTSLELGSSTGRIEERTLAFAFLRELWDVDWNRRARWIFWEGVDPERGDERLRERARGYRERIQGHLESFANELAIVDAARLATGRPTCREAFEMLVDGLRYRRDYPAELRPARRDLIGDVRRCMALVGIQLLDPDLVILDEFQRFKDLLDPSGDSWANQLANRLFAHTNPVTGRPTRTLLLSATPYRMYSLADEDADDHYKDFLSTCSFLMDDPGRVALLANRLTEMRRALTAPDGLAAAREACRRIERELRSVMARTERLSATPDRAGMLDEPALDVSVEAPDVAAYLRLSSVAEAVSHGDPSEYWKSSPYLLNFMEAYQLKQQVDAAAAAGVELDLRPGPGVLDWETVDAYEQIDPQNGRLRWLLQDLDAHHAFELLWVPPSLPYYRTGSIYEDPASRAFTKRLIFSGWTVVPKAVSTLVSHEAERRAFARLGRSPRYTQDYSSRGGQRLEFPVRGDRPERMTSFLFVWPSAALADAGDPRPRERDGVVTVDELRAVVRGRLEPEVTEVVRGARDGGVIDQRWYWAAPLLLDDRRFPAVFDEWFGMDGSERSWTDDPGDGFLRHAEEAWAAVSGEDPVALGRPPDDLLDVLVDLAIGGPAVCALRALSAVTGLALTDPPVLTAAAHAAWGFRSLFNAPEATALVDSTSPPGWPNWRSAIGHCVDGNLQALVDEHAHVLRDWLGFVQLDSPTARADAAQEIGRQLAAALDVRTSSYRVDAPDASGHALEEHRMRGRFAVPFGNQRLEDGGKERVESVSAAFNSPFWPFVLASTSVGQEGLDFHLWCHAVVHWNLPANPVDLEQREGRVHRFKGHAVRRNLASAYGQSMAIDGATGDLWDDLFARAAADRDPGETEMHPYWVFNGDAKILRLAPVLPFSRDAAELPRLRRSLAAYRLAIGQPRQEELVEYLERTYTSDEIRALLDDLRIDLTPPDQPTRYPPGDRPADAARPDVAPEAFVTPALLTVEEVMRELAAPHRDLLRPVLERLVAQACLLERPSGARQTYINVRPPAECGESRLASVNLSTGRLELQTRSWEAVVECSAQAWFDEVPAGEKAAITITSIGAAQAAYAVIDAYLERRRVQERRRRRR